MEIRIRASGLGSFIDCNKRFFVNQYSKLLKAMGYDIYEYEPSIIPTQIGKGLHAGASHAFHEKKNKGRLGKRFFKQAEEKGITELQENVKAEDTIFDTISPDMNSAEFQLRKMLEKYYNWIIVPEVKPHLIEYPYEGTIKPENIYVENEDLKVIITGHPDLVEKKKQIRDIKTGKSGTVHFAQLGIYSILYRTNQEIEAFKRIRPKLIIDHVPRVSVSQIGLKGYPLPVKYYYNSELSENIAYKAINKLISIWADFFYKEDHNLIPENPHSMLCSPNYCRAHGTNFCPITKGVKKNG